MRDHARLNRLADADIVRDQQAYGIELQGENKRQELEWTRPERKATGTPKRRGAAPEEEADRIEQKPTRSRIANDARVGTGKARGLDAVAFERNKEPNGGSVRASYRLEIENVLSGRRQNDPVASARPNYRSDLKRSFCPQFSALLSSQTTDDCSAPMDDTVGSLGEP